MLPVRELDTTALIRILETPDLLPQQIDLVRKTVLFFQMSRDRYRRSSFLDHRAIRSEPGIYSANLSDLTSRVLLRKTPRRMHYILHGGFCCSTLLARYFEAMPGNFVLKEPALLTQLSTFKLFTSGVSDDFADFQDEIATDWHNWLHMSAVLLGRTYETDDVTIIKANDLCNWMGELLLAADSRTKILFVSSPLRVFVLSVLKFNRRRLWIRNRFRSLANCFAKVPFLANITMQNLDDETCAAAVWLLNSFLCGSLLSATESHRVLAIGSESIVSQPRETLLAAMEFLELAFDEARRVALSTLTPFLHHSKDLDLRYDGASRAIDLQNAGARFGSQADKAVSWATYVASAWISKCPFSIG
jgi:hypothetical protein